MSPSPDKAVDAALRVVGVCDVLAGFAGVGLDAFVSDTRTQWAAEMGLIRIGEDINRMPSEVLERYPEQPWREIVSMRNFAAHQYDDLEPRRVWRTLTRDVPALRAYLLDRVIPVLRGADPRG